MKRILKSIAIVAAAAMSFAACQKEVAPQEKTEQGLYKYTFNVVDGEAKVDAETKAILGDSNVEWVSGDQVGVFIADNANYANMDVTGTPVKAVLYSNSAIPAGTMVYGFYPYNELNKTSEDYSNDFALISFAAAQHGKATSSMPLAGVPFEVQEELAASAKTGNGELKFMNLGSIVNFKVWSANQDEQSETVQYIVFTANDNAEIAGDAVIDLTAVDPANASTLAVTFMDGVSSVKVEQESSVASAKGSGEGVKMVIAPGTFSGTLKVGTDAHTYYFDIPEITFNRSAQRSINVNLANAVIKEGVDLDAKALPYEEKFDVGMGEFTVEDITNPDGVTVWSHSNQGGSYMKASAYINSQRYETESMLVSPWIDLTTVSAANVSFDHAHRYAGTAANELTFWVKTDEAEAAWQKLTIPTYASGTNWTFVNSGNIDLSAFVGHNVKVAFKYISDGTNAGTSTWEINNFIVDKVKSEAGLAYATAEYTANVGEDFTAPTLTNPHSLTVTYSSSNENVALVDEATGEIVIGEAGVAVITASFAGNDDYYEGSASYTIKVTDPNIEIFDFTWNLAEDQTVTATEDELSWSNDGVTMVVNKAESQTNANNYYPGSGRNSTRFYTNSTLTITPCSTCTIQYVTFEATSENYANALKSSTWNNATASVNGTTVTVTPADGTKVFNASIGATCGFTAVTVYYSGELQPADSYSISIDESIENGTVSANVNEAEAGRSIVLTVTPNDGYELESLIINDEDKTEDVVDNECTFIMPASNVTVTATFVVSSGTTATINFGSNDTKINAASVTGDDSEGNSWTITTVGTTSFTSNANYYQVGSSSKPATSITFTTTLPDGASVSGISAKFGGFNGTAGDVNLKVGDNIVGTGSLNASSDVTVESTSTASGNVITITVTNISKGVKVYYISVTY